MARTYARLTAAAKHTVSFILARLRGDPAVAAAVAESLEVRWCLSTVTVTSTADTVGSTQETLRDAIDFANTNAGDTTIQFAPAVAGQTIDLLSSPLHYSGLGTLTIIGSGVTVKGNGTFADFAAGDPNDDVTVDVQNMNFTDGGDSDDAAVGLYGTASLTGVNVSGSVSDGLVAWGNVTLTTVQVNTSGEDGIINEGGMALAGVTVTGSLGEEGILNVGGGGFEGHVNATNLTVDHTTYGYGFANDSEAVLTLSKSNLTENAGGLRNSGEATLDADTISHNVAESGAGLSTNGTVTATDVSILSNTATTGNGGGIDNEDGDVTLTNCTVDGNSAADGDGGGLYATPRSTVTARDDTIADNTAAAGGGVDNAGSPSCSFGNTIIAANTAGTDPDFGGVPSTKGYNFVGDVGDSGPWDQKTDLTGTAKSKLDPMLAAPADNGGTTLTALPLPRSLVIAHGYTGLIPTGVTTDQRGEPRTYNNTVDIGSVEVQAAADASIVVSVPTPTREVAVGADATIEIGSVTVTDATGPYPVTVTFDDGTTAAPPSVTGNGDLGTVDHKFTTAGAHTVHVKVTDAYGFVVGTSAFVVNAATLAVAPPGAQTVLIDTPTLVSFGTIDETAASGSYSTSVTLADGTTYGPYDQNGASNTVKITPEPLQFDTAGPQTLTVSVTDGTVTGSATITVNVVAGSTPSSVAVTTAPATVLGGSQTTLTATVSPPTATGVVTFTQDGQFLGTGTITNGTATLITTGLYIGTTSITATYGGNAIYGTSGSEPVVIVVTPAPLQTSIVVGSSAGTVGANGSVTLTAAVDVVNATAAGTAVTGSVSFYLGEQLLGSATVVDGVATLATTVELTVGAGQVTAAFAGNDSFAASTSAGVDLTVVRVATQTAVTASVASKTAAQPATLVATVTPAAGTPVGIALIYTGGTVTYYAAGLAIGTAAVGADGTASLQVTTELPGGLDRITAEFNGDAAFSSSTSADAASVNVTEHAVVPTVERATVPATMTGGLPAHGSVAVRLVDELADLQAGPEVGYVTVGVYLSPAATLDPGTATLVGSRVRRVDLGEGRTMRVAVPLGTVPAGVAGGAYRLIVQTTDSAGNTESVDTGKVVDVVASAVVLRAAFAPVPADVAKVGAAVTLTDAGNATERSTFTATVGLATDAAGQDVAATGAGTVQPMAVVVRGGKTTRLRVTGWQGLFDGLAGGPYYLVVTLTDASGHTAFAVSPKPI